MRKLKLDVAELKVEGFDTFVDEDRRGSVRANLGCPTWSCLGTCGAAPDSLIEKQGVFADSFRNCCA